MDIARSFSHMFKDSSWFFKVFVGGIFLVASIVIVGLPFILGYEINHIRGIVDREEYILPEWKNMRKLFKEGSIVFCATLIYAALLLSLIVAVNGVPTAWPMIVAIVAVVFFWMPLILIQFTKRPTFFSCFSLTEIFGRTALHPVLTMAALGTGFLTLTATILFGWMSIILGWPFVVFWGILVQSFMLGQLAKV
ncbi:MAG: DUF4013 domain-containing protein [Bacteroidota bacterium]